MKQLSIWFTFFFHIVQVCESRIKNIFENILYRDFKEYPEKLAFSFSLMYLFFLHWSFRVRFCGVEASWTFAAAYIDSRARSKTQNLSASVLISVTLLAPTTWTQTLTSDEGCFTTFHIVNPAEDPLALDETVLFSDFAIMLINLIDF